MSRADPTSSHTDSHQAPKGAGLPEHSARAILRKLRDLDLRVRGLSVDSTRRVHLEGCLSPDAPIEKGLVYRLRMANGSPLQLAVAWVKGAFELSLAGQSEPQRLRRVEFITDPSGRATAEEIGARMHPDACDPREVEHFLRRLIRAAFAASPAS